MFVVKKLFNSKDFSILFLKFVNISICVSILYILIYNILHYNPIDGYDAEAHYNYVYFFSMYLPDKFKLPSSEFTREFFNPPVPYIFPAFFQVFCRNIISSVDYIKDCQLNLGTFTQVFQSLIYLLTIYFYLLSFKLLKSKNNLFNLNLILLISMLSVNYRTISMIRGETYILLFNSILMYKFLKLSRNNYEYKISDILISGVLIGLMALSRQWAFLLFLAYLMILLFINKKSRLNYLQFISQSFFIGFMVSSWFYFNLYFDYGSFTAFNKSPKAFSLMNQNLKFYLPFNLDALTVFTKPIRPNFSNQLLPILYSDTWGDYWGYFVFTSNDLVSGKNQMFIGNYLARVNIFSLIPSVLIIFSLIQFNKLKGGNTFHKLLFFGIIFSFLGFLWFLIKYPEIPTGDTIKATYIIQLFHLAVIICASYLEDLKEKSSKYYLLIISFLLLVYAHNFSAYLSHFPLKF
tara:strand:- start:5511 stop:6899 length:1389 start_codon:yes stop_codon:yes gene_type:complete